MTRNPYAPPGARVGDVPTPSVRASAPFWAHFYLWPTGRTGRLFYWLFGFLPLTLLGVGAGLLVPRTQEGTRYLLTVSILLFWPQGVILARRLHDLNLAGSWVALFWIIPLALALLQTPLPPGTGTVVAWVAAVVLGLIPGTAGPNRYGNDPRGTTSVARDQTSAPAGPESQSD